MGDYFEQLLSQNKNYVFIALNVAYDEKETKHKNHWVGLIIDKKHQLIFYLDPAKKTAIPTQIENLKTTLNYQNAIILNPIDFQQREKQEGWIRHCGAYIIEIFKVFRKCIQNDKFISGSLLPNMDIDKNSISLQTALSEIPCGEVEGVSQIRKSHIESACTILGVDLENTIENQDTQSKTSENSKSHSEDSSKIITHTRVQASNVDTINTQIVNVSNVPEENIDDAKTHIKEVIDQGIKIETHIQQQAQVDRLQIGIGNITTTTAAVILTSPTISTTHTNNPGKLMWHFSGENELRTVTLRIEGRMWQEEFARLRLPTSSLLLYKDSLKTKAHRDIYEKLCHALEPVEKFNTGNTVVLQGSSGLGKTYCAQYYFYHQAANKHQMVAWFPSSSKEAFLQGWHALAQQLRNLQSPSPQGNDNEVIQDWCENKLGQWLFIMDEVDLDAAWLVERLPQRGGHVLITTNRPNYQLHQKPITLTFSPLSLQDSQELLQVYFGEYWQTTGQLPEQKALEYLSLALGGFPVALTQMALFVNKKGLSFERAASQFKLPMVRNHLLKDTIFDQLKDKTFMATVQKGWQQLLAHLNKHYPHLTQAQHEKNLQQFIIFLEKEAPQDAEFSSGKITVSQISVDLIQAYFVKAMGISFDLLEVNEFLAWLRSCLPLSYNFDTHQWQLSLASLSALKLQSGLELLSSFGIETTIFIKETTEEISANSSNSSSSGVNSTRDNGETEAHETPKIPSGIDTYTRLENSSVTHAEIDYLTVGKPSEFKVWQLPTINPYFIPRQKLTDELSAKLLQKKEGEESAQLFLTATTGMGGIGKTELARHFITDPKLSAPYKYTRRFWLMATTDTQLSIEFRKLAVYLGLIDEKKYIEDQELITHVHKWLSINPGWLMVLDNADDYNSIAKWIPKEGGSVLVTTREPKPGTLRQEQILPVPLLEKEEAVTWLYKLSGRNPDNLSAQEKTAAVTLAENLGYLPLGVAQAAAYLRAQSRISIEKYQTDFSTLLEDNTLAKQEASEKIGNDPDANARRVVARTWTLSLRAIEKAANARGLPLLAEPLLAACAYYAPKDIPAFLLENFLKEFHQVNIDYISYVLDEYIGQLLHYSLLERSSEKNSLSIHRLVQSVIKTQLQSNGKLEEHLRKSIKALLTVYSKDNRNESIHKKRELLSHFQEILKNNDIIAEIDIVQLGYLLTYVSNSYLALGHTKNSKKHLKRALTVFEKHYGKDHPEVAITLGSLGIAYSVLGDAEKSKEYLERALTIKEKHYGKDHPEVAITLTNLANTYSDLGDGETQGKELEHLERALTIKEKHFGKEHYQVAITLSNLGAAYDDLGDVQKSKELLERALIIFEGEKRDYGKNHFEVAGILTNLGNAYGTLGDPQKQKEFLERALLILEKHYGKDHPEVASILESLGNAYGALGNSQKQKELLERALTIQEKYYGKEHPKVTITLTNLGNAYVALGDAQRGKELLKHALIIQEAYYGKDHYKVSFSTGNLGNAYGALGDSQKQKELLERALTIQEKHYDKEHYQLAFILNDLANLYGVLGDLQKQKKLIKRALTIKEKHYGKEHYQVAITLVNLGNAYGNLGDPQKQKKLIKRALSVLEKHYGKDHYQVAITLVNLGNAYCSLGDAQKQKKLIKRALSVLEKHYGKEHPEVAITLESLGIAYGALGNVQRKKELLEHTLTIFEKHYGKDHPNVAITFVNLASAYGSLGDAQKKKEFLERALTIFEKHYGEDHYKVATILTNLGNAYCSLGDAQKQKELLERALTIQEKHYGKEHPEVTSTLESLGNAYGALGNSQKQKELLERALTIQEKHYDKEHYQLAFILNDLANLYGVLGDPQKQKELLERALTIKEKYYGKDHYQVAAILTNLGNAYGTLGDAQKKKELLEHALTIKEKHYGKDHPEVAITIGNLGNAYGSLGDAQKQKELLERALTIFEKHFGKEHYQVAITQRDLGITHYVLGNVQDSKDLLEKALSTLEKYYGKNTFNINTCITLITFGHITNNEELIDKALTLEKTYHVNNDLEVDSMQTSFGWLCNVLGTLDKKMEILKKCLPLYEKHYGLEHKYKKFINKNLEEISINIGKTSLSSGLEYLKKSGSPLHSSVHTHHKKEKIEDAITTGNENNQNFSGLSNSSNQ